MAASTTIDASAEVVFAAGWPTRRPALTSTAPAGRASADGDRITGAGQVFRLAMYHEGDPDKDYETANLVALFDEPHAIAWKPSVGLVTGAVGWSCRDVFVCEVG